MAKKFTEDERRIIKPSVENLNEQFQYERRNAQQIRQPNNGGRGYTPEQLVKASDAGTEKPDKRK